MKRIFIFLSTFISLWSCELESELEIGNYPVSKRLVLNSILQVENDTNCLYINNSYPIFDPANARKDRNSWMQTGHLDLIIPSSPVSIIRNNIPETDVYANPDNNIIYYVSPHLSANDIVQVQAEHNGRVISAKTTIPPTPQITRIDTTSFKRTIGQNYYYGYWWSNTDNYFRIKINIKDPAHIKNFYRLLVNVDVETHYDPEYTERYDIPVIESYTASGFISEDPVITNGNPPEDNSDFSIITFEQNHFGVFTDEMFDGQEYPLNVFIPSPYENYYGGYYFFTTKRKYTLKIRLQSLSEDLYRYYTSLQKYTYYNDELIEPVRVYNNVEGGLGILGSINQLTEVIWEEEYVKE